MARKTKKGGKSSSKGGNKHKSTIKGGLLKLVTPKSTPAKKPSKVSIPKTAKKTARTPSKYKQPSIVSGMSINDIVNMDIWTFEKLSESDMRKVVGRLVSSVNKRMRRFEEAGIVTPATRALEKSGGLLSTKGKDLNQLRHEYARARNFLNMETSSQAGYKRVQKQTIKTLKERGVEVSPEDIDEMWRIWDDLTELDPSIEMSGNKYTLLQDIANMPDDIDFDEKRKQAKDLWNKLYEDQQRARNEEFGVSGYFE